MVPWRRCPVKGRYRLPQISASAIQTSFRHDSGINLQLGNGYNPSAEQDV
jgi:hypothetical protein